MLAGSGSVAVLGMSALNAQPWLYFANALALALLALCLVWERRRSAHVAIGVVAVTVVVNAVALWPRSTERPLGQATPLDIEAIPSRRVAVVGPLPAIPPDADVALELTPGQESNPPGSFRTKALRINVSNLTSELFRSFAMTVTDIRWRVNNAFVQVQELHGGGRFPAFRLNPAVVADPGITRYGAPPPNEAYEYDLLQLDASRMEKGWVIAPMVVADHEHKRFTMVPSGIYFGDWKVEILVEVNGRTETIPLYFNWNEMGFTIWDEAPVVNGAIVVR